MYRINPLPKNVLITTDEVIALSASDHTIESRNYLQSIEIAETAFILPLLGEDFYDDFRSKKNVLVTAINLTAINSASSLAFSIGDKVNAIELVNDINYTYLWNEYLWKIIAECVEYKSIPSGAIKTTSQGQMVNNPKLIGTEGQGAYSAEIKDVKWKRDDALFQRINPLLEAIKRYLCKNKDKYTLYKCDEMCNCHSKNNSHNTRRSPLILGLYGNKNNYEDECCEDMKRVFIVESGNNGGGGNTTTSIDYEFKTTTALNGLSTATVPITFGRYRVKREGISMLAENYTITNNNGSVQFTLTRANDLFNYNTSENTGETFTFENY